MSHVMWSLYHTPCVLVSLDVFGVLQCVAVCCSVLQCVAACWSCWTYLVCCSVLQRVAACCSVLQCVAAHCSALQRISARYSALQCVAVCWDSLLECDRHADAWLCVRVPTSSAKCAHTCANTNTRASTRANTWAPIVGVAKGPCRPDRTSCVLAKSTIFPQKSPAFLPYAVIQVMLRVYMHAHEL